MNSLAGVAVGLGLALSASGCCSSPETDFAPEQPHSTFHAGVPMAFTTAGNPRIQRSLAGFAGLCSEHSGQPDFDRFYDDVFPGYGGASPILAMSLGQDNFHVVELNDHETLLSVPSGLSWVAIEFAVNVDEVKVGDPALAPEVEADLVEVSGSKPAAATVYCYVLPFSAIDGPPAPDSTGRALISDDMGISASDDIQALNMHAALFCEDGDEFWHDDFFVGVLRDPPELYFSLSPDFLEDDQAGEILGLWGESAAGVLGRVFRSSYDGTKWATPESVVDLGAWLVANPDRPGQTVDPIDNIDSLSVRSHLLDDPAGEPVIDILFSRGPQADVDDQYEHYRVDGAKPRVRRVVVAGSRSGDGPGGRVPVARRIGAGKGLGDTCSQDPHLGPRPDPSKRVLEGWLVGWRLMPEADGCPIGLQAAAYRSVRDGVHHVTTCVDCPEPPGESADVRVNLYRIDTFVGEVEYGDPASESYPKILDSKTDKYEGRGLTAEFRIDAPSNPADLRRPAYAVQWEFRFGGDGGEMVSHMVVLRD